MSRPVVMSTIPYFKPVLVAEPKPLGERRAVGYMPYLDGLCGIAIILVLLLHAGVPHVRGGWVGIDIVFVVSGYPVTSLLFREQDEHGLRPRRPAREKGPRRAQ